MSIIPQLKKISLGISGSPVVKNPSLSAGDMGSIPGWGTKIPHAAGNQAGTANEEPTSHNKDPAQPKEKIYII